MGECTQPLILRPGYAASILQGDGRVVCHIGDTPQIDFLLQDRCGCGVDSTNGTYTFKTSRAGSVITTAGTVTVKMQNPAYGRIRLSTTDTTQTGPVKVVITELRSGGLVETYGPFILQVMGA